MNGVGTARAARALGVVGPPVLRPQAVKVSLLLFFLAKARFFFALSIVAIQRSWCLHELDGGFYLVRGRCEHAHCHYETPVGPPDALYNLVDFQKLRISCIV